DIYDRFTPRKKKMIVAIVSYSAFLAPFTSSVFLPSIPQMASDLKTTATVINYTVAIFIATIGIAPVVWSPLAGFYGRKPIYLAAMPLMIAASIGVGRSRNIADIIGTRILQGIGSSCVLAVGAGTIGDIFRPTERANAMGWFYMGALCGPSLSPVLGGILTEYTRPGWRLVQYILAGAGAISFFLTLFFLPETSHPPLPHDTMRAKTGKKFVIYWFNPLTSLGLFRWPNIVAATFVSSCVLLDTYVLNVSFPFSSLIWLMMQKEQYHIDNVAVSGCFYLVMGGGNWIGARFAGPYADKQLRKYIAKRGYRRAEDRLPIIVIGTGLLMPVTLLIYGWLVQTRKGGLAPSLIMLFINGFGQMCALTPINTYAIDAMQTRSAEVIAVNNCVRYLFAAGASAVLLPIANAIGWGWTMTITSVICWMACGMILLMLKYGTAWREKANAKYGIQPRDGERPNPYWPIESVESVDKVHSVDFVDSTSEKMDVEKESESDQHHDEQHEEPSRLLPRVEMKNPRSGRDRDTRVEMPAVEEVLRRTVSLSGASVHGG
ncbi:hypothetical protein TREMEDRAFT_13217, partial [Tremella mesenterica DSM 1558]|uniref:uncharacterized protein n=1 Tax=Tremella mesenterica (strain ATCC 24925 / CBS 8224 / DSM 1558 / NBRC 9311 / NRRL Y-6157 / RJB 2259-6 / UBC 559-6) TaxID=578456 RepID=UPI0003F49E67